MKDLSKRTITGIVLLAVAAIFGVIDTFASTSIRNVNIPTSGGFVNSQSFRATDGGLLRVTVQVRAKTILAAVPGSRFQILLMRGNQTLMSKIIGTNGMSYASAQFNYSVRCSQVRANFHFRIRNVTPGPIKLPGEAKFVNVNVPTKPAPKVKTISPLTVRNGRPNIYAIPSYMVPTGKGGKFEFDLNWRGTCRTVGGCKIKFVLKYKGRTMKEFQSTRTGRIQFSHSVRGGGTWRLEATGIGLRSTQRVKGTLKTSFRGVCG